MRGDVMSNVATGDEGATKSNMLLPGVATLVSCGLIGYHYGTNTDKSESKLHFLSILCLQMFPLVALKLKMYQCGDRLSLVPRVLVKTLLMHFVLSILRLCTYPMLREFTIWGNLQFWLDVGFMLGALLILRQVFGFKWTLRTVIDEHEVRNLVVMGVLAAVTTETLTGIMPESLSDLTRNWNTDKYYLTKIVFTSANYVDVLAFVPVVLKLFQIEREDDQSTGTLMLEDSRRQVLIFFAYVVTFYSWDDVLDPLRDAEMDVSMMAHAAHFVLLLDFACFFIFQVWSPSSAKGEQLQGLLEEGEFCDD